MKAIIYCLVDPREPEHIRYVGITARNPKERLSEHIKQAKYRMRGSHKINWIVSLLDAGIRPRIIILENTNFCNEDDLYSKEIELVSRYKSEGHRLVNTTIGGKGCNGCHSSASTRAILSAKAKEQWSRITKRDREKISKNTSKRLKGNSYRKGKKDPPQRLESKRIAMKGKNNPKWRGYLIQMDNNLQEIDRWESIEDAAAKYGITYKSIWSATSKKTKSCGFYWKYETK